MSNVNGVPGLVNVDKFNVQFGSCGNNGYSFTGTGSWAGVTEHISGTVNGPTITFDATYDDGFGFDGYKWTCDGTNGSDNW